MYIGRQPIIGNFVKLDTITTSATTTFNLLNGGVAYFPQTANNCLVSLNGILQAPTDSYTISGSTIIFSSALTTSDVIDFIIVLGDVLNIGTPSDNTVSLAKLTATGTKDSTTFLRGDNTFASAGGANTPAFHARMSANQTLSNATFTKVVFDTEEFDTNSAYDTSTYRFTVPSGKAGKYFIYSSITAKSNDVPSDLQAVALNIYKNGSSVSYTTTDPRNAGFGYYFSAYQHVTLSLAVGDYIEIFGYIITGSGTPLMTNEGKTYTNSFGGFKIIE